jgi:hypothetical protein
VVVKSVPETDGQLRSVPDLAGDRASKPQYVDLASALCSRVLPRMMDRREARATGGSYIEEALPAVADDTFASEWVVEVARRSMACFEYGGDLG